MKSRNHTLVMLLIGVNFVTLDLMNRKCIKTHLNYCESGRKLYHFSRRTFHPHPNPLPEGEGILDPVELYS